MPTFIPLLNTVQTCLLAPDIVEGPYYVNGEQHRNNITETQEGLPFLLDIGLINTATCEPLTGVFVDVWCVFVSCDIEARLVPSVPH